MTTQQSSRKEISWGSSKLKADDGQVSDLMHVNKEETRYTVTVKPTVIKPDAKPSEFGFNHIFDSAQDEQLTDSMSSLVDFLFKGENCALFTMNQAAHDNINDIYFNHPLTRASHNLAATAFKFIT